MIMRFEWGQVAPKKMRNEEMDVNRDARMQDNVWEREKSQKTNNCKNTLERKTENNEAVSHFLYRGKCHSNQEQRTANRQAKSLLALSRKCRPFFTLFLDYFVKKSFSLLGCIWKGVSIWLFATYLKRFVWYISVCKCNIINDGFWLNEW